MKPFRHRLEEVAKFTEVVAKTVIEYDTTRPERRSQELKGEYKDYLFALRRNFLNLADDCRKEVEKMK